MHRSSICILLLLIGTLPAMCGGCTSDVAVATGQNTALDGMDLVQMTSAMAAAMRQSPSVQAALKRGPLRIVVQPVENQMVSHILPRGAAEAFTGRVRALLSEQSPQQFFWVMNSIEYEDLRHRERSFDLGPVPQSVQPEYALAARFMSLDAEDSRHASSYYLCTYELLNLETRQCLWSGRFELKKAVVKGFWD